MTTTRKKGTVHQVSESELKERLAGKGDERRGNERIPARLKESRCRSGAGGASRESTPPTSPKAGSSSR